jgi:FeS assembly SUF system protein
MKEKVIEVLNSIYDPEIPVNIWELGFIYKLEVNKNNDVYILMTLTAPNCPVAESLPMEVKTRVSMIPCVNKVEVEVTFDPPWEMDMMTEAAKLELGLIY